MYISRLMELNGLTSVNWLSHGLNLSPESKLTAELSGRNSESIYKAHHYNLLFGETCKVDMHKL